MSRRSSRVQDQELLSGKRYRDDDEDIIDLDAEQHSTPQRRSSRETGGSSSSSRPTRRAIVDEDEDMDLEERQSHDESKRLKIEKKRKYEFDDVRLEASETEISRFQALDRDAQTRCIREVSRVFLFKGTKKEVVTRENVNDVLRKIDEAYKAHTNAVIQLAQDILYETTGYLIVRSDKIKAIKPKKDKTTYASTYYLYNMLESAALRNALNDANLNLTHESSFIGFMFVVFHAVLNAPGNKVSFYDLLQAVRKIDSRFPNTLTSMTAGKSGAVEGFEEDFIGLIMRMKEEHYIICTKEAGEGTKEADKNYVEFGPRFFLEVGKEALLRSYFAVIDEPMDEALLQEVQKEEQKAQKDQNEEDD